MLKTTGDLNAMLLSLIEMLQDVLSPLSDRRSGDMKLDFEMADWLLLILNELFQHLGKFPTRSYFLCFFFESRFTSAISYMPLSVLQYY